jgi:WXG100 family type VII secretion target
MQDAVSKFNAAVADFEAKAQDITSDINQLAEAWLGDGYDNFATAMSTWVTDLGNVTTDLNSMGVGVSQSNSVIHEADQNIADAFRRMMPIGGGA